jgi:hypothetical protein
LDGLLGLLEASGWGWFTPWNGGRAPDSWSDREYDKRPRVMDDSFAENGWERVSLDPHHIRRYGLGSRMSQTAVYIRNLRFTT